MAGYDWLHSFLKRNTNISLRTSKSTSLARMSSFNHFTVNTFFKKWQMFTDAMALMLLKYSI